MKTVLEQLTSDLIYRSCKNHTIVCTLPQIPIFVLQKRKPYLVLLHCAFYNSHRSFRWSTWSHIPISHVKEERVRHWTSSNAVFKVKWLQNLLTIFGTELKYRVIYYACYCCHELKSEIYQGRRSRGLFDLISMQRVIRYPKVSTSSRFFWGCLTDRVSKHRSAEISHSAG